MAGTLVKPVEIRPMAVDVNQKQARQVGQTVERKIVSSLSSHHHARKPIAKPRLAAKPDIDTEVADICRALRAYQSTNSRVAVYIYLSKVFAVVSRWRRLDCALKNARATLRRQADAPQTPGGGRGTCTNALPID